MDEILKLREELERERMRLAACGVVALSNTPDSAEKARTMHDDYRSASCDDVARAVDRQMALHNALTAVMSYSGVRDYLGRQVSEIADSALMGTNVQIEPPSRLLANVGSNAGFGLGHRRTRNEVA